MDIKCDERNVEQRNPDNFIMLPTVDFCFKELMKNPKVRQGFVAAILGRDPKTIRQTQLMNTELHREFEDDKLGILDVLIELDDGSWMNRRGWSMSGERRQYGIIIPRCTAPRSGENVWH